MAGRVAEDSYFFTGDTKRSFSAASDRTLAMGRCSRVPATSKVSSEVRLPVAVMSASLETKPLFLRTVRNPAIVTVLPGFSSRIVNPSFKLTVTSATPSTFRIATRTA